MFLRETELLAWAVIILVLFRLVKSSNPAVSLNFLNNQNYEQEQQELGRIECKGPHQFDILIKKRLVYD